MLGLKPIALVLVGLLSLEATYIPPYYEGIPTLMGVSGIDPPDYRGEESYRVEFNLLPSKAGMPEEGFVHRQWVEFEQLRDILTVYVPDFDLQFPDSESLESANAWLRHLATNHLIVNSNALHDFLGINWNADDCGFLTSLEEFMKVVIPALYRAPVFAPEPPILDSEMDVITAPETPFEQYTYLTAFRAKSHLETYLTFFENFLSTCPSFSGPEDDSDVAPPGHVVAIPPHFNQTFVHFLPGGYLNGHTVRISYLGKDKFNFLGEPLIREWLEKLHGDKSPKRILDLGTGPGFTAFVMAAMWPEAEVIAVDLAAPYIRMARMWQEMRNVTNLKFYHANGEDLSWLESDSFDLINYSYVLHEMPADNCVRVLREIYRLLTPGGTMNGFEVPYWENELERLAFVEVNTWGEDWQVEGAQGPEPYIGEYEIGAPLPQTLVDEGFLNVEVIEHTYFESIFLANK